MALNIEAQKTLFHSLVEKNIHRDGIKELMEWLDSTDFFEAHASTRFHGAEAGGLCAHSIAVAREIIRLARIFNYETVGGEKKQIYSPCAGKAHSVRGGMKGALEILRNS